MLKTLTDETADKPLNSSQASSVNFSLLFHSYVKCRSALLIGITHAVSVEDLCYLVQQSNHFFILERLKIWVRGVIIVCVPCIKLPIEFCVTYKIAWDVLGLLLLCTTRFGYLCILDVRAEGLVMSGHLGALGPAASRLFPGGLKGAAPWTFSVSSQWDRALVAGFAAVLC